MQITYLFRHPGTGHSIEGLFASLQQEVDQRSGLFTNRVYLPKISRGLWSVWLNLRFLRSLTADVFHISGDIHYAALVLPAAHTVLTIHDCSTLETNRKRPLRFALFWLLWYYLPVRWAGVVTVVSEKTRQELIHYLGKVAQKVIVVPNGYDPGFDYCPTTCQRHPPVLLQMGTAPNKNLSRLLAALEGIDCTLVLVGPLTKSLSNQLQIFRITYQQYENLNQAEVRQLYLACDIVTFVSTYEGFGMPVLEANAVGRVVITSAIAPMNDLFAGTAHFVEPTSIDAIRAGILRLINDELYRQTLIEAGRLNAQYYTVRQSADQYVSLYHKMSLLQPASELVL